MRRDDTYDAIVVGSGISGGWAAKELTEAGLRTLVLEAGRPMDPVADATEHKPLWEFRFRGLGDRRYNNARQPIQSRSSPVNEMNSHLFVDDVENPYTFDQDKPFYWIRGRHVGGRSIMWGRQVYRWSDLDFEANARDGLGVDWPIRYADIAPWYDHVEEFIGVSGEALGLAHLPDGKFLPPMPLTCAEQKVQEGIARYFPGERVLTIGRVAVLTADHRGREACHYCGPCERGCITRSYFSSVNATLPAANATGRLRLRPYSVVDRVLYDARRGRATGVRAIDAQTKRPLEFRARIVFLCASALESARILLNSGFANASGELGRNLMDHIMGGGANGVIDAPPDRTTFGARPNGIYVPRFRNVNGRRAPFQRGYAFQGWSGRDGWGRGSDMAGFGADFKHALRKPGPWRFTFYGFGEMLPRPENRVELDKEKVDAWGIPVLRINCVYGDNEKALVQDMAITGAEMLAAAGAHEVEPFTSDNPPGLVIHEMGTARMGRDARTPVLNGRHQCWDAPNVFVTDGACMTSSANQNPSLTYMALTARAAAHAVELTTRNEL